MSLDNISKKVMIAHNDAQLMAREFLVAFVAEVVNVLPPDDPTAPTS